MALIVLPEGTQVSGSIGGTTYSRNRFGAYKRSRSVPVNPNSGRQVAARNAVKALAIGWDQILTQGQRDAWNLYAANVPWTNRLGQVVSLTGLNMYLRTNSSRIAAGVAQVATAPAIFDLAPAELSLSVAASEATQLLTVSFQDGVEWSDTDGGYQSVAMGQPQNAGIGFFGGPWRLAPPLIGDTALPLTSPVDVAAPFPFVSGQRIWVQTRIGLPDGRLSSFARVDFLAIP